MTTIRVATFNIRNGLAFDGLHSWPMRRRATARAITALDADVIGLQEVYGFQLHWLARRLPGYDAVSGAGRSGGHRGEHCPVLVRHETAELRSDRTRWFGTDPDAPGIRLAGASFPRIATICVLKFRGGSEFQFVNTHLDEHLAKLRCDSATQLVTWLDSSLPRVLVGDLNDEPASEVVRTLEATGLRSAVADDAGGTAHNFSGRTDGRRIDHIFVSDGITVLDGRVRSERAGHCLPSDHWPVVATLSL
jgi:endonuclease/exonuclease/phosphatase family metal-dependent hydrolase